MQLYVDSSVVLRIVFHASGRITKWNRVTEAYTSELARTECFRTLDRMRLTSTLDDVEVARLRTAIDDTFESIDIVALDRRILRRAAEPMPTALRTLDAIHIASALGARVGRPGLMLATHDAEMAIAATALGFRVLGV